MKKIKTTCHVCHLTMKTPVTEDSPSFCEFCGTNLLDTNDEMGVLETTVSTEAGGVKADLVSIILTNKRIVFTGEKSGKSAGIGWILGGLIGGLIAGALSKSERQLVSVKFEDMVSLDVEPGTKLLNKNKLFFTIHDKNGKTYVFDLGKKIADEWEAELRRNIAH